MFEQYEISGKSPGSQLLRTIQNSGYNLNEEHEQQSGMAAYNVALLIWKAHSTGTIKSEGIPVKQIGRNDPCPCKSGKKHKKCCLGINETNSNANLVQEFDSDIIPRFFDEDLLLEDCARLGELMSQDEKLRMISFSIDGVGSFVSNQIEKNLPTKKERFSEEEIDKFAVQYMSESGEWKILKDLDKKILDATTRVTSTEDLRALATGLMFNTFGRASKNHSDDLMGVIIFRNTISKFIHSNSAIEKFRGKMGENPDDFLRKIKANDGGFLEAFNTLNEKEKTALHSFAESKDDELWSVISSDEFPVYPPFATILPLFLKLGNLSKNDKISTEDLFKVIEDEAETLNEDDYRLYGVLLKRWIDGNPDERKNVVGAAKTLLGFCEMGILSRELFVNLAVLCVKNSNFSFLNEEEEELATTWLRDGEKSVFLTNYIEWLNTSGFPLCAEKLTRVAEVELLKIQDNS